MTIAEFAKRFNLPQSWAAFAEHFAERMRHVASGPGSSESIHRELAQLSFQRGLALRLGQLDGESNPHEAPEHPAKPEEGEHDDYGIHRAGPQGS